MVVLGCPVRTIREQFPLSNIQGQCVLAVLTANDLLFCVGEFLAKITP